MYPIVKQSHVILVLISVALFQLRYWRYKVPKQTPPKLIKISPHVIDTLLLISGVALAVMAGFSPLNSGWLLAKLLALVIYILAGTWAMKASGQRQWNAYLLATVAVIYMLLVATHKLAWPW